MPIYRICWLLIETKGESNWHGVGIAPAQTLQSRNTNPAIAE
jgi:hypothetical protein